MTEATDRRSTCDRWRSIGLAAPGSVELVIAARIGQAIHRGIL